MKTNKLLIIGGILSMVAALLHVAIILGGPGWYRFFGAGEGMAKLAENGSTYPTFVTTSIAIILTLWALYAFSGAGLINKLPFLKPVLIAIGMIYLLRGIFGIPLVIYVDHPYLNELEEKMTFMVWSSIISISYGVVYLLGSIQISFKKQP